MLKSEEANEGGKDKEEKKEMSEKKEPSSGKEVEDALKELQKYLKEQLAIIDRKMTNLQSESNQHGADIDRLKLLLSERKEGEGKGEVDPEAEREMRERREKMLKEHEGAKKGLKDLREALAELDRREDSDVK